MYKPDPRISAALFIRYFFSPVPKSSRDLLERHRRHRRQRRRVLPPELRGVRRFGVCLPAGGVQRMLRGRDQEYRRVLRRFRRGPLHHLARVRATLRVKEAWELGECNASLDTSTVGNDGGAAVKCFIVEEPPPTACLIVSIPALIDVHTSLSFLEKLDAISSDFISK